MFLTKGINAFNGLVSFIRSINNITYNRPRGFINDTRGHEDRHASIVELKIDNNLEVVLSKLSLSYI